MPRTRDLAVMSVAIVALFGAIVAVLVNGYLPNLFQGATAFVSTENGETASAVLEEKPEISREDRVTDLARKVAAYLKDSDNEEIIAPVTEVATTTEVAVADVSEEQGEMRCASYARSGLDWSMQGLKVSETEGVLLVYRERAIASTSDLSASRDMLLELPLRGASLEMKQCIGSDVIGITQGGALIRNSDLGTYRVFGSSMLIGYALDGYPIYGAGSDKTDACGGRTVSGQYRYQLSPDRDTMINCFVGTPASL
jgi:hypothetical protein